MVYLHGGAHRFGTSGEYDGSVLAARGAVVVTAAHRVGAEGYPEPAGAPANRALLDQMAAPAYDLRTRPTRVFDVPGGIAPYP
nr:carboxylesterase family protein [Actinocorallia herbida]